MVTTSSRRSTLPVISTGLALLLATSWAHAAEKFRATPTLTISQQTGFQNGATSTFGIGNTLTTLGNNTNTVDGGVTTGQGDGPTTLRATLDPADLRWHIFTTYDYGKLDIEGPNGVQSHTNGGTLGMLYRASPRFALGGSLGGLHSNGWLSGGTGTVRSDGLTMAAFGVVNFGDTFVDLLYSATLLNSDFTRQAPGTSTTGEADSTVHSVALTVGHNLRFGRLLTGPRLGVNYSHWSQDGFSESGPGALIYPDQNAESLITRVEWFTSYDIKTSFGTITPRGLLGWHRETMGGAGAANVGVVGGGVVAGTGGVNRIRHYMVAGAGVSMDLGGSWKASADYLGQFFGGAFGVHNVSVMLSYGF